MNGLEVNQTVENSLSHASKTKQILHWDILSLHVSFITSRHLEPHISRPGSPGAKVGSTLVTRIHNRKVPEPVHSHTVVFLACFEDKGSSLPQGCPKEPIFQMIARPSYEQLVHTSLWSVLGDFVQNIRIHYQCWV